MFRPSRNAIIASIICLSSLNAVPAVPAGAGLGDIGGKVPEVVSLWLADATTDSLIGEITDGASFDSSELSTELTVVAKVNEYTESVQFGNAIDLVVQTENYEPYAMNGDLNGDLAAADLQIGTNVVRVTPYGVDGAEGAKGKQLLVSFSIVSSTFRVDTTIDGHDAKPGDGVCGTGLIDDFGSRQDATADTKDRPFAASAPETAVTAGTASLRFDRTPTSRCTLRAAIEETNALDGWQRIVVPNNLGDYDVVLGQLHVSDTVRIEGEDTEQINGNPPTIDANGRSRVFLIYDAGSVTLSWLRITGGDAQFGGGGVAISNTTVSILDCRVTGNRANEGGGVYTVSSLIAIKRSTIDYNTAGHPDRVIGGGITQRGGGLSVNVGGAFIEDSTIESNSAVRGGGIYLLEAALQTTNVEIIGNEANTRGGGLNIVDSTAQFTFTTIADNAAGTSPIDGPADQVGGGFALKGSKVEMANSILANNTAAFEPGHEFYSPDCATMDSEASVVSRRGNVVGVISKHCYFIDYELEFVLLDYVGFEDTPLDPRLSPGYRPDFDSPAIDNAVVDEERPFFNCPPSDRGGITTRAQGNACDSGAWEERSD